MRRIYQIEYSRRFIYGAHGGAIDMQRPGAWNDVFQASSGTEVLLNVVRGLSPTTARSIHAEFRGPLVPPVEAPPKIGSHAIAQ